MRRRSPRARALALCVFAASATVGSRARATTFVFSTFLGDTQPEEKLSIYTSTDGLTFTVLSDTGFAGSSGTLRDPSIMRYRDGRYYVAYTNPPTASCCGNADHFTVAVSTDLIHWQDIARVGAGVAGVAHTWAPEWLVGGDVVMVIANIDTGNGDFHPYAFTPLDSALTSWSGPTALGIGPNYIDTCVVRSGGIYHAFIKNETTRFLEHATSPALTGPWTFVGRGDWAGLGTGGFEGPSVVKLDDGTWRMYLDPQTRGVPCKYLDSRDLNTWSAPASLPGAAGMVVRHGTVIRDEVPPSAMGTGGQGGATGAGGAIDGGARADSAADAPVAPDAATAGTDARAEDGRPSTDGNSASGAGGRGAGGGSRGSAQGGTGGGRTADAPDAEPDAAASGSTTAPSGCGCAIGERPRDGTVPGLAGLGLLAVLGCRRTRRR